MADIYPLTADRHGTKQFVPQTSWSFVQKQNLAPVLCTEFAHVACEYPLVFFQTTKESEQLSPFALFGLQADLNSMVDAQGQWLGKYIPAVFRGYPFMAVKSAEGKDDFVFCIDESAGHLVDKGGQPLFDKSGKKTAFLEKTFNFVREYQQQAPVVTKFCEVLQSFDLFSPLSIELRKDKDNRVVTLAGLFRIDEEKLAAVSVDNFQELRRLGMLPLIYAHLLSLRHLKRLAEMQAVAVRTSAPTEATLPESFSF